MNFTEPSTHDNNDLRNMKSDRPISPLREYEDTEFVSELFGKPIIDILDKLYNQHNMVFYRIMDGVAQFLKVNTTMEPSKKKHLLEKAFPRYETFVEVSVDRIFNIFQQYFLDNILYIPEDPLIVWDHYKDLNMNVTDEDMDTLDEELKIARDEVITQLAFKQWITKEKRLAEKSIQLEQEYHKQLAFMNPMMKEYNDPDLDDAVRRMIGNAEELENHMQRRQDEVYRQGTLFTSGNTETNEIIDFVIRQHLNKD